MRRRYWLAISAEECTHSASMDDEPPKQYTSALLEKMHALPISAVFTARRAAECMTLLLAPLCLLVLTLRRACATIAVTFFLIPYPSRLRPSPARPAPVPRRKGGTKRSNGNRTACSHATNTAFCEPFETAPMLLCQQCDGAAV